MIGIAISRIFLRITQRIICEKIFLKLENGRFASQLESDLKKIVLIGYLVISPVCPYQLGNKCSKETLLNI